MKRPAYCYDHTLTPEVLFWTSYRGALAVSIAAVQEMFLPLYGTLADMACSAQAILMTSQLRSLESIALAFSTALGKKVCVYDCLLGDAVLGGDTLYESSDYS